MSLGGAAFRRCAGLSPKFPGSLALAAEYAMGGTAIAPYGNDGAAKLFFTSNHLDTYTQVLLASVCLLSVLPIGALAWLTRAKKGPRGL